MEELIKIANDIAVKYFPDFSGFEDDPALNKQITEKRKEERKKMSDAISAALRRAYDMGTRQPIAQPKWTPPRRSRDDDASFWKE